MPEPACRQLAAVEPFEHDISKSFEIERSDRIDSGESENRRRRAKRMDQPRSATQSVRSRPICRPRRADDSTPECFTGRPVQRSMERKDQARAGRATVNSSTSSSDSEGTRSTATCASKSSISTSDAWSSSCE